MSIRSKVIIGFVSVFLVVLSVFITISGLNTKETITDLVHRRLEASSRLKTEQVYQYMEKEVQLMEQLATSEVIRELFLKNNQVNKERVRERLQRALSLETDAGEMMVVDDEGLVLVSTKLERQGKTLVDLTGKITNEVARGVKISDEKIDERGEFYVWATIPLINNKGEKSGELVKSIYLKDLYAIISDILGDFKTIDIFLVNTDLNLITQTRYIEEDQILKKKIDTVNTRGCLRQHEGLEKPEEKLIEFDDYRGVEVIGTHSYIKDVGICLITKVDKEEAMAPYRSLIWQEGIVFLISLLVYLLVGMWVTGAITKSLSHLMRHVQRIKDGDFEKEVDVTSRDEIGVLAKEVDSMRQRILESQSEIRRQVKEQTAEIIDKTKAIEDQQTAIANVLEDVQEERDQSQAILYSIGDGVLVVDKKEKIVLINKVALSLAGASEEEAIGKDYKEILRFVDEKDETVIRREFVDKAIEKGEVQEMANHTVLISKNGRRIPVADSAAPLKDVHGKTVGCVVVFRDVGRERELDRLKDDFISMTSHELRTPLGAIKGFSSMILEGDYGDLNVACQQPMKDILASSERMIKLVNDLLNLSRIESGKIKYELSEVDIEKVVEETVNQLQSLVKERGLTLTVEGKVTGKVQADKDKVSQIIVNLIGNAIKFTEKGGIKIICEDKEVEVMIKVEDTGIGIAKEDQDRLFKKFERVGDRMDAKFVGTGLGLYVSREIVRKMGGELGLESSESGKGSVFAFSLPKMGTEKAKLALETIEKEKKIKEDQKDLV